MASSSHSAGREEASGAAASGRTPSASSGPPAAGRAPNPAGTDEPVATPRLPPPARDVPPGLCRGCGAPIDPSLEPRAKTWHSACASAYREVSPKHQRAAVEARDGRRCARCGVVRARVEVDHVVPLSRGGENRLRNLQTLCVPCHRAKTAAEAAERSDLCASRS